MSASARLTSLLLAPVQLAPAPLAQARVASTMPELPASAAWLPTDYLPVVWLQLQSALVAAGVRAVLSGMGFTVLASTDQPHRAGVWLVDDALLATPEALAAALTGATAVVSLGSPDWALLLPELELTGWAALPGDATPAEVVAGVLGAAAGLATMPSSALGGLIASGLAAELASSEQALAEKGQPQPGVQGFQAGVTPELEAKSSVLGQLNQEDTVVLTPRESEVLELLSLGLSNKRAARDLGITESTIKFHLQTIYSKLGVQNRAAAVSKGIQLGLVRI